MEWTGADQEGTKRRLILLRRYSGAIIHTWFADAPDFPQRREDAVINCSSADHLHINAESVSRPGTQT